MGNDDGKQCGEESKEGKVVSGDAAALRCMNLHGVRGLGKGGQLGRGHGVSRRRIG